MSFALPLYKDLSLATQSRLVGPLLKKDFDTGGGQSNCDVAIANDPASWPVAIPNR